MTKKALLGLHYKALSEACQNLCEQMGYSVDSTSTFKEMLDKARTTDYQRYIMDLNFGYSGSTNIDSAIEIYKLIESRVEEGSAKFLGISGNDKTVRMGIKEGIPSKLNVYVKLRDFLED